MRKHSQWLLALAFYITAFSVAGGSASILEADLGTVHGTQWSPYLQWTAQNPTWNGNPFDVSATVEFTHHPTGEKRRTEMFFTGGNSWAFRFTDTMLGMWSFVISSEGKDLQGHTGKVMIESNPCVDAHGFLKKFDNKWGWEATENVFVPQLVMWDYITGDNSPRVFHNKPELVDYKIQEFIADHGFNGFHVPVIAGRWFDLDTGSDRIESTMTEPDTRTFEALELLITKIHQAGGQLLAMRESQSNCGYLGQNDPVLHFGLGRRNSVDVVVLFLDETKAVRHRVAANQTIRISGTPKK